MQTHHDKHDEPLDIGTLVHFHNIAGKKKLGRVTEILPTCVKVFTTYRYFVDGKEVSDVGEFPVVPTDCEVVDATIA